MIKRKMREIEREREREREITMEVERDELYIHSEKLFDILRTRCPEKIAQFERSKNCLDHRI